VISGGPPERAAVRGLPRPGGARGAPAPGGLVHRPLVDHVHRQVRKAIDHPPGTPGGADVLLRRPPARRGVRRQGLAGAVGRPARHHGLPRRRAVRGTRDRGLLAPQPAGLRVVRRVAWAPAARRRPRRRPTATPRPAVPAPPAGRLRGVRAVEALRLQPGRRRSRLRRPGHRPQPRRRGGDAARQRPAVAGRASSPASGRCCRPPGPTRCARSSRCTGSPSGRRRPTASSAASTTWSRSAPGRRQHRPRPQGRRSTCSSTARRGSRPSSCSASYERQERLADPVTTDDVTLGACASCGMPTTGEVCAFCRQRELILAVLPVQRGRRVRLPACRRTRGRRMTERHPPARSVLPGTDAEPLAAGELVLLSTARGGATSSTSSRGPSGTATAGLVEHDALIGAREGSAIRTMARAWRSWCCARPARTSCSRCGAAPRWSTPRTRP
jgi:hypothetical protein